MPYQYKRSEGWQNEQNLNGIHRQSEHRIHVSTETLYALVVIFCVHGYV